MSNHAEGEADENGNVELSNRGKLTKREVKIAALVHELLSHDERLLEPLHDDIVKQMCERLDECLDDLKAGRVEFRLHARVSVKPVSKVSQGYHKQLIACYLADAKVPRSKRP